jgi:hypothetical protein
MKGEGIAALMGFLSLRVVNAVDQASFDANAKPHKAKRKSKKARIAKAKRA